MTTRHYMRDQKNKQKNPPKNKIQLHEDVPSTWRRGERTGSRVEEAGEQEGSTDRMGVGSIDLEALYSDVGFMDKQAGPQVESLSAKKM